jgi:hypothetical protein
VIALGAGWELGFDEQAPQGMQFKIKDGELSAGCSVA